MSRSILDCQFTVLHTQPGGHHHPGKRRTATHSERPRKTHCVVGGLSGSARLLDINRTTLLARMKKMGIRRDK